MKLFVSSREKWKKDIVVLKILFFSQFFMFSYSQTYYLKISFLSLTSQLFKKKFQSRKKVHFLGVSLLFPSHYFPQITFFGNNTATQTVLSKIEKNYWVARFTYGKELWVNRPLLNRCKEHIRLLQILCFISLSQWGKILKTMFECEYALKGV